MSTTTTTPSLDTHSLSLSHPQQLHEWAEIRLKKMQEDEAGIAPEAFQVCACVFWGGGKGLVRRGEREVVVAVEDDKCSKTLDANSQHHVHANVRA